MSDVYDGRFDDLPAPRTPETPLPAQRAGQGTMVEQARAIAEVRAAVMIARDNPRDRSAAINEMREICSIPWLAERAFFRVQRGKEFVNGETIHLARELARCWGNIDYGVKELLRDDAKGQSELLAFAWDLQTNARSEITFVVPHRRDTRSGPRPLTGTQEIYENNASYAGRRLREAIFAVLPVWFKAEAAEICHRTLEQGGGKPLSMRIADLRSAFESIGVGAAQLEKKRGRKVDDFLAEDVAALRVIYLSIKRNEVTIAEEFPPEESPAKAGPPRAEPPADADAFERAAAGAPAGERPGPAQEAPAETAPPSNAEAEKPADKPARKPQNGAETVDAFLARLAKLSLTEVQRLETSATFKAWYRDLDAEAQKQVSGRIADRLAAPLRAG
jgi:hypothetical protein